MVGRELLSYSSSLDGLAGDHYILILNSWECSKKKKKKKKKKVLSWFRRVNETMIHEP